MNWPEGLKLENLDAATSLIVDFIRDYVDQSRTNGVVMGLSGGIDSALVATLAAKAIGPSKVWATLLPVNANSDKENVEDARQLAKSLGIGHELFEIGPVLEAFEPLGLDQLSRGNLSARMRMAVWYARANQRKMLVIGTGNKAEIFMGYFTKYGDGGVDFLPLANLYKVNVRQLAAHVGVSEKIVNKAPSAGLWTGQTDEGEMGIRYDDIDRILYLMLEQGRSREDVISWGIESEKVDLVLKMMEFSQHKRDPLPRPKSRV
jgi:NAD+ synthase